MWKFLGHIWSVSGSVGAVLGVCVIICVINHVLVCVRPKMAMEIGLKKMEQRYDEWAAHEQPTCSVLGL